MLAAALAGAASVASGAPNAASGSTAGPRLAKPRRLREGDLVGLVAPGGVLPDGGIEKRVANLESLGFKVRLGDHIRAAYGSYAGRAQQRAADLHTMFRDRDVRAIWAARGGSGCLQVLPHLDYSLARRHPKIVIGYSDITALHLALYRRAGLVTFHGPTAGSTFSDFSVSSLRSVLMEPRSETTLRLSEESLRKAPTQPQFTPRAFRHGIAEGRLVGGNLSVVCAMLGTPYMPAAGGNLVFLEDIGEAPYRIDRMLTQLALAGITSTASGVMMGVFQRCEPADGEPSLSLAETLATQMESLHVPSVYGFSFGHIPHIWTLPVGVRARLDTTARTVTLLESAVA
ncbi:MAG TPA: LD-carboxypeptidase [Usitatibacter sp.]|nr:LD-carboxypeptidase [Usitatibacter sp.]